MRLKKTGSASRSWDRSTCAINTLIALRVSQVFLDDKLIIKVPDRIKTSMLGRSQPLFSLSPFKNNENLCIFKLVKYYLQLEVTRDFRTLFFTKPHKALGSQTISRWIRSSLQDCGVKTDIFLAYSTRHASTSIAARKGVQLDLIKQAAR